MSIDVHSRNVFILWKLQTYCDKMVTVSRKNYTLITAGMMATVGAVALGVGYNAGLRKQATPQLTPQPQYNVIQNVGNGMLLETIKRDDGVVAVVTASPNTKGGCDVHAEVANTSNSDLTDAQRAELQQEFGRVAGKACPNLIAKPALPKDMIQM